jgi:hypothetical protein
MSATTPRRIEKNHEESPKAKTEPVTEPRSTKI